MMLTEYVYPKTPLELDCNTFQCSIPIPDDEPGLFKKWNDSIKSFIYHSVEYKRFVKRCKLDAGIPTCIASGLTNDIELHHHPLTLSCYVLAAMRYMQVYNFSYTSLTIADLVLRMHYEGIVCYTYLSKSYHSKFHESNDVVIPEEEIRGDMEALIVHPIMKHMEQLINHPIMKFMDNNSKSRFIEYCPAFVSTHDSFFKE